MKSVKLICMALCAGLFINGLLASVASAQDLIDSVPPVIEMDETTEGIAGETQVFSAQVSDNVGLSDVTLFYRFSGQQAYESIQMDQLGNTAYFSANVPTTETEVRAIEYYIQASDEAGNQIIKGFAFDPFMRHLSLPAGAPVPEPSVTAEQSTSSIKWWYLALGVLAAGAIAAAAGGGNSGGGGSTAPTQVPGTVTVPGP